jgi:outer membrane lipoprotein SlyB
MGNSENIMSDTSLRTHPLVVIAATTVILTCLIAIAMMVGIIPTPLMKDDALVSGDGSQAASASRSDLAGTTSTSGTPQDPAERDRVGGTSGTAPAQTVTGGAPAPKIAAVCSNCGTVTSVHVVKQQGEAGLIGPAAGTAVGGLIGSQIGHGSGRTVATIVGAAGGAAVGTEIERRYKATTHHVVSVRLNDGTTRRFTYASAPAFREGDRVRVVEGRLVRNS